MASLTRILVLTGARTNFTGMLGKYPFVKGEIKVKGSDREVEALTKYLGRCYKAFAKGSDELMYAQEEDLKNGIDPTQTYTDGRGGPEVPVQGDVQPDGGRAPEVPTDDGGGADDASPGSEGDIPGGDGQPDPRVDGPQTDEDRVRQAVASLDGGNDEHWTNDGRPLVGVVADLSGVTNVTRSDIDRIAPNHMRPPQP